jgi:hypothetical protein
MTKSAFLLALAAPLAACASPARTASPGSAWHEGPPPMTLVEGPSAPSPANDIPEARRLEWHEAHRPRVVYVPERHVVVERVVVRESEPVYVRSYEPCWDVPVALSFGFWGGRWGRHHRRGWGWGVSSHRGWGCW